MSNQSSNIELDSITIDFRLDGVTDELAMLKIYLDLIEDHIKLSRVEADRKLAAKAKAVDYDDGEMAYLSTVRQFEVEYAHPRIFRGPFLVTLFAVYESAVTEIAGAIRDKKCCRLSLEDIKWGFLGRAKKYYEDVLQFDLASSQKHWQNLTELQALRNITAHANGRRETAKASDVKKVHNVVGVSWRYGCLAVKEELLRKLYTAVKEELESLVARYKAWDDANQQGDDPN